MLLHSKIIYFVSTYFEATTVIVVAVYLYHTAYSASASRGTSKQTTSSIRSRQLLNLKKLCALPREGTPSVVAFVDDCGSHCDHN